ncbi:MAG: cytochrome c oxidase accessory protein CcoG [Alphaproteobacteria bacterium]|nr:cytochrome c oxidase accessory protein CcoG [Alphaproteobacteria bacterium]
MMSAGDPGLQQDAKNGGGGSAALPTPRLARAVLAHRLVVPQAVSGRFRRIKWVVLILVLTIWYVTPFLRWDRGVKAPGQAVLLDFAHGRLHVFSLEIWPQDFYVVTGMLIVAVLALILANALSGRVWCGFACPQTVWTDLFLRVERIVQGDRRARIRRMEGPGNVARVFRLALTHMLFLVISLITAIVLVGYFTDLPDLLRALASNEASAVALTSILVFTGTTYSLAGFAREQVCTFMCPWPRLQGAIWDPEAFTVNYRDYRGESRMSARKAAELRERGAAAGDCVDCALCVNVCPIGIDIREGPNFACINCGLCVDACDGVMAKLGRKRGLIDFESWTNVERGRRGEPRQNRLLRTKTVGLTFLVLGLVAALAGLLASRASVVMTVLHDRDPLVVTLSDGSVRNAYTVKLLNKTDIMRHFSLAIEGIDATLEIVGRSGGATLGVEPNGSVAVRVTVTTNYVAGNVPLRFIASDDSGNFVSVSDRFLVP